MTSSRPATTCSEETDNNQPIRIVRTHSHVIFWKVDNFQSFLHCLKIFPVIDWWNFGAFSLEYQHHKSPKSGGSFRERARALTLPKSKIPWRHWALLSSLGCPTAGFWGQKVGDTRHKTYNGLWDARVKAIYRKTCRWQKPLTPQTYTGPIAWPQSVLELPTGFI